MIALAVVALLWAGMVLGISFLEAPVKFRAPSLTLPVGLDVGRQVFGAFNKVEIVCAVAGIALAIGLRPSALSWGILAVAVGVLAVQTVWLLPLLDARVGLILAGETPEPAPYHLVYIVLEVVKLGALVATALRVLTTLKGG